MISVAHISWIVLLAMGSQEMCVILFLGYWYCPLQTS